ncbi:MAG: short-chain dehydrogenase [Gemmatimonadota bacterium]
MDLGLKGRTALVCGSSSGLGRAIAEALAAEGADVVINSRSAEKLAVVRDEIVAATGARVEAAPGDLADPAAVERVVGAARQAFGHIDILVTNTGGPPSAPFEAHSPERWTQYVNQLLLSVVNLTRAVLPEMKARGWGRIVNVTSITVKQPVGGLVLSNTVRAGVTGFAKTISNEVAPHGVTVNNVLPGYTRTERLVELAEVVAQRLGTDVAGAYASWEKEVPMGRLGEPEELGALAAFLCSEKAAYITGQSIAVDGGWIKGLF